MSRTSKTERQTITTTYEFNPTGATLGDLRGFVEETVHLPAGSPIQTTILTNMLAVHETRVAEEEA